MELIDREYGIHLSRLKKGWMKLKKWLKNNNIKNFSEEIGFKFCDEVLGDHILNKHMDLEHKLCLRAVRMLISYQRDGDFEYRSPSINQQFEGDIGSMIESFFIYLKEDKCLSYLTIKNYKQYLYKFYKYLDSQSININDLSIDIIDDFYSKSDFTLPLKHNSSSAVRKFLSYAYEIGATEKDLSIFVLKDVYKRHRKLPTTYTENEIKKIISSVDRSSVKGKRDYLVILLAAEYGWRAKDIVNFRFDQIDWDKNIITITQSKNNQQVEFPLIASVGNAIIDYVKNGRECHEREKTDIIILSANNCNKGKPLSKETIHSIVTQYMRKANIKNFQNKKHGPHSLRHSLASHLLKNNVSMPIISTVLGHQNTESTKIYLSIDIDTLRQCTLPIPKITSAFYKEESI
ncbi:MAG: site-specific integrase [Clostridiales Family XIII bacterium]|jgi:site-specific recombinase XerD|nr:site-specific integrase [Clostridiales Family XIII bacterium]